jgi:hypothetical protein
MHACYGVIERYVFFLLAHRVYHLGTSSQFKIITLAILLPEEYEWPYRIPPNRSWSRIQLAYGRTI